MVIFDGPDASGKSTLIKDLRSQGFQIHKPYYPSTNQLKYYLLSGPLYQNLWLERYYPSEMVYPRVKPGRPIMEEYKQYLIEASLAPFNPVHVYIRPRADVIMDNLKDRGDDYITPGDVDKMVSEYDAFMLRSLFPVITYDYKKDSVSELLKKITLARKTNQIPKPAPFYPNVLSAGDNKTPNNIMFVGEEPSATSLGQGFLRPFISDSGSSLLLHECLYEAGVYGDGMPYFTNFFKFTSHEQSAVRANSESLDAEIQKAQPSKIICLGQKTYDHVKAIIDHSFLGSRYPQVIKLNHPSYIKRFGGKEEYIQQIKNAII